MKRIVFILMLFVVSLNAQSWQKYRVQPIPEDNFAFGVSQNIGLAVVTDEEDGESPYLDIIASVEYHSYVEELDIFGKVYGQYEYADMSESDYRRTSLGLGIVKKVGLFYFSPSFNLGQLDYNQEAKPSFELQASLEYELRQKLYAYFLYTMTQRPDIDDWKLSAGFGLKYFVSVK